MTPKTLAELESDVARDLELIGYPNAAWVPSRTGAPMLVVLVVGGGQGGLAIAAKLQREQVRNILVVDENPRGAEGIWMRYARMHTLRTPKHIGGPDLGIPSLTFQAWYEAQHGADAFAAIKYIPKAAWQAYLAWIRVVLDIPVLNEARFAGVRPEASGLSVTLVEKGVERVVLTRKLVLAGGIETSGRWWMPPEIAALPVQLRAHTADSIDFASLKGREVVVIGAGASAFDNAATALEHGASVRMLCRRPDLQRVQPYKVIAFSGFLEHLGRMPDADRWRIMRHLLTTREALTAETWARATRHPGFELVTGAPVLGASHVGERVRLQTGQGRLEADFVICGTGFDMDLRARPELAGVAEHVATWADIYTPPPGDADLRLGRYPYLDDGMAFMEQTPGGAPWVRHIYCFNFGATMSFGPSGSSISAMKYSAPRVVSAITQALFREDLSTHEQMILAYATPEFDLVFAREAELATAR
jgi:cation diffusion facilitator CzcD-associated flavoprotein CzcO